MKTNSYKVEKRTNNNKISLSEGTKFPDADDSVLKPEEKKILRVLYKTGVYDYFMRTTGMNIPCIKEKIEKVESVDLDLVFSEPFLVTENGIYDIVQKSEKAVLLKGEGRTYNFWVPKSAFKVNRYNAICFNRHFETGVRLEIERNYRRQRGYID